MRAGFGRGAHQEHEHRRRSSSPAPAGELAEHTSTPAHQHARSTPGAHQEHTRSTPAHQERPRPRSRVHRRQLASTSAGLGFPDRIGHENTRSTAHRRRSTPGPARGRWPVSGRCPVRQHFPATFRSRGDDPPGRGCSILQHPPKSGVAFCYTPPLGRGVPPPRGGVGGGFAALFPGRFRRQPKLSPETGSESRPDSRSRDPTARAD